MKNTENNLDFRKTVIINRAVPGSGKTTISRCINQALASRGLSIGIHSTDNYFTWDNRYHFDITRLGANHKRNQREFERDLARGTDIVICDNTNLMPWQTRPYTDAARKYGYQVIFLNFQPRELWKHVQSQIVTPEKPDAHEVPEERLVEFINEFNTYDNLLGGNGIPDYTSQHDYRWNNRILAPEITRKPVTKFDADHVIRIDPDEYHVLKNRIGGIMLDLVAV